MVFTLKAARINKNYSQEEAAKLIGISVDTLSNYERGLTFPDVPIIRQIEKVYGLSYNEIKFLPDNYEKIVKEANKSKEECK